RARDAGFTRDVVTIKNWSTGTNATDLNVDPFTGYYYCIKARNLDNVETICVALEKEAEYTESKKLRNNVIKYCSDEYVSYYHYFEEDGYIEVIIYDITGEIIKRFARWDGLANSVKLIEWDGRDDEGRCVAPGYYIMLVKPLSLRFKIVIY
ncbi:MAG: hypothetical protein JW827_01835, partial [Spirochaetes bacterium]|nr:hypothetical protein [Spirochaetota bacterium]